MKTQTTDKMARVYCLLTKHSRYIHGRPYRLGTVAQSWMRPFIKADNDAAQLGRWLDRK